MEPKVNIYLLSTKFIFYIKKLCSLLNVKCIAYINIRKLHDVNRYLIVYKNFHFLFEDRLFKNICNLKIFNISKHLLLLSANLDDIHYIKFNGNQSFLS